MPSAGHRGTAPLLVRSGVSGLQVTYATDEKVLFQELITIIRRCVCVNFAKSCVHTDKDRQ